MEERGVLGRHALHDENHHVAAREIDRRAVGGLVHGREALGQFLRGEIFPVFDASRVADSAQDAERVA